MIEIVGKSLGRYHIIEPLGEGGMAAVYKAFDTNLERDVAVKVIRTEKGTNSTFLKRFQREAKALAHLDHPYILKVLDYGEQAGIPYLVMPFVPGGTLKQKMGVPMPYNEAARLLAPVARALDYAHREGFIHRDIKPANILITKTGDPILSDFGIAKILDTHDSQQLTMTGEGIGTPDYMAPEQWMGITDVRSDIYSLGVVFYELVTGRRPYMADTPAAVFLKHRQDPLPRPTSFVPGLPEAVEGIIFKCLAKEPEDRYQHMGDFAQALENLIQKTLDESEILTIAGISGDETEHGTAATAPLSSKTESTALQPARHPRFSKGVIIGGLAVIVISLVLCFVLGGGYYLFSKLDMIQNSKVEEMAEEPVASIESPHDEQDGIASGSQQEEKQETAEPVPSEEATYPVYVADTAEPFDHIEGLRLDVPVISDNNGDLIITESSGANSYIFSCNHTVEEAAKFYLDGMESEGWELVSKTQSQQNNMISYSYTKETNAGMDSVTVSVYESMNRTYISLTVIEIVY